MVSQKLPSNIDITLVADALANQGYIIIKNALPEKLMEQLQQRISSLKPAELHDAKIGRQSQSRIIKEIRGDKTFWLENDHKIDQLYLSIMDNLRLQLNERLFLGLFEYESHYALYPPGTFYAKHLDVLEANTEHSKQEITLKNQHRILSSVLYLNPQWENKSGGELILYDNKGKVLNTVYPDYASLVLFLSSEFPHEVKPTQRTRYSIAGWFKVNSVNEIKY